MKSSENKKNLISLRKLYKKFMIKKLKKKILYSNWIFKFIYNYL
jgi:hypothetical protein